MTRHLLVIGAQRSGTTYLHALLDAHPQITMARPGRPEPKVFLSDDVVSRGAGWYRDTYFGHATGELLLGEKSTSYLECPAAADRAARVLGDDVEVVAVLRDPVARAVSNWRFSSDNGLETRPLETALRETLARPRGWDPAATSVSPYAYLERGRYVEYLEPWLERFPGSHLLLLQDLLDDDAAVGRLYAGLGVDASFRPPALGAPVNESSQPTPPVPADLVTELHEYFRDSDTELARRLGRALPWTPTPLPGVSHA